MIKYDNTQVKRILVERFKYMDLVAELVSENVYNIHSDLHGIVNNWLEDGREEEYSFKGVSLSQIRKRVGCDYLNALFSMSVFLKNPDLMDDYARIPDDIFRML